MGSASNFCSSKLHQPISDARPQGRASIFWFLGIRCMVKVFERLLYRDPFLSDFGLRSRFWIIGQVFLTGGAVASLPIRIFARK
jgi:hypothetical protein